MCTYVCMPVCVCSCMCYFNAKLIACTTDCSCDRQFNTKHFGKVQVKKSQNNQVRLIEVLILYNVHGAYCAMTELKSVTGIVRGETALNGGSCVGLWWGLKYDKVNDILTKKKNAQRFNMS